MRPLNIKITGFGPYADCTEIRMEELGEKGLYLITGDTGAGKTTIFDAICYALFGEASGENRDGSMLRSKYAAPDTPTEVELTFSHMGKVYVVKRNPEYMRLTKKGDGETKQIAKAELTLPDGSVITKIKAVTDKVEEILGINKEQFSQIAMLAQGDFLKLLIASTDERIKIFRDIFKTQNYLTLQRGLDSKYKELYGQVQDGRKSIEQYISGIQVDSDNVLSIEVDKAKNGELTTEDVLELLGKLTDEDSAKKDKVEKELERVTKELEEVNKSIGTAETLEKARKAREEAKALLEVEKPKEVELNESFKKTKEALKDKAELEKKAHGIEADYPKYDRADELQKDILKIQREIDECKRLLGEATGNKKQKEDELNSLKDEKASFKDTGAEIERLKAELSDIKKQADAIDELDRELKKYFEDLKAYEENQKHYRKENESFIELNALYESMEQTFRNAQAGILADGLTEGVECPVCGSTHHPKLAKLADEVPSEKDLESAKKKAERAREIRDERAKELSGQNKALETVMADLSKKCEKLLETDKLDDARGMIETKKKELVSQTEAIKNKKREAEKNDNRGKEIEKLIPKVEKEIGDIDKALSDNNAKISGDTAKEEAAEKELKSILDGLNFKTKVEAEAENGRLLDKAAALQKAYDTADDDLKKKQLLISELEAKINENEKTLSEAKNIDLSKEHEAQKKLKESQDECIRQGKLISGRLGNNERTRSDIEGKVSSLADIEKKLRWVKALADTANGKLTGKDKVMLETYIQTTYFDRIINRANIRLLAMSGNQYELIRLKEAANARSQSGLDLGVTDHYNGTQRSVKTLSGGESFMASLSLALGLSDEVQSSAGGIQIDTMFVDEGFGTLDSETLDTAYRALAGLTEGNRLVGIISHVAELKDRIDRQIVVTKEKTGGSKVRIV